uniref:P-type phospholipid transporter n=1 Tax=Acrobeloides nanus TaxID=290746 RepID=A0A914D6A9_9BILA
MILLGATAIEDKLQEGVPDTIAKLTSVNIKIWVLTGDKMETAINIGYSCKLLTEKFKKVFLINGKDDLEVETQLNNTKIQMDQFKIAADKENLREINGYALLINGDSLAYALKPTCEKIFLEISCQCKSVICCRVTPLQKAQVVEVVKRNKGIITLAIGDGANDVSMIKTAHIGVGISGYEGNQAALASDYSIGQFRYLERLLLVHGRWSYYRMSKFLRYFFYKNFAFTLANFWFSFFSAYSAQAVYDAILLAAYNTFFTQFPVLAMGAFDQDVNDEYSLAYPKMYIPGQYNLFYNIRMFMYSLLYGVVSYWADYV